MADSKLEIIITAKDNASGPLGKIGGALLDVGKFATGMIVADVFGKLATGVTEFFTGSLDEARESIATNKQLEQVIKSTGGAAGVSADEARGYADALSKVTNFSDDAIIQGENLLLTFTGIGEDVFPQATETMLDMSQALGQDMKSSAIQLGKALNDPVKGITALSRVGVSFTDQQKEMIAAMVKAGDVAGAQQIILDELAKEFGGSARALADPAILLQNAWADFQETVGMAVLPVLNKLGQVALPMVSSAIQFVIPYIEQFGDILSRLGDYFIRVVGIIQEQGFERFFHVFEDGSSSISGFFEILGFGEQTAFAIGAAISNVATIIQNFIAAAQSAFSGNWLPLIRLVSETTGLSFTTVGNAIAIIINVFGQLQLGIQQLGIWLIQLGTWIMPLVDSILPLLSQAINFVFYNFNIIGPIIAAVGAIILALSSPITAIIAAVVLLATAWANNWGGIQEKTRAVLDFLKPYWAELSTLFNTFITLLLPELQTVWQELVTVWQAEVGPALAELWASLQELFVALGFGTGKTNTWKSALGILKTILAGVLVAVRLLTPIIRFYADSLSFMIGQVRNSVDKLTAFKRGIDGIYNAVRRLIDRIRDMANQLANLDIPDWLTPGSPTPFELGIEGIGNAIGNLPELQNTFNVDGGGALATASPVGALGGGLGGSSIIINLTYAPAVSLADKLEAEQVLAPFIANGVRNALAGKR